MLARELSTPDPLRARRRALGRRGDTRPPPAARAPDREHPGARRRELPRRRARPRAPAANRARRAGDERRRRRGSGSTHSRLPPSRSSPNRTASTPDELYRKTAGNPFFVVEVLAADATGIPDTVRDAVLARVAALSPSARDGCSTRSPSCRSQAELSLLEALAGDAIDSLDECLGSGILAAGPTRRRVPPRACAARGRGVDPAEREGRVCTARLSPCLPTRRGVAPDLARLAHHAEAALDDATRSCGTHRRRRAGRALSARIARLPRSTRVRCATAPLCRRRARRAARAPRARVLPDRSVRRGDRRARGGDSPSPRARAAAPGGRRAAATGGVPLVPGPHRRGRARSHEMPSRCSRRFRRAASLHTRTRISPSSTRQPVRTERGRALRRAGRSKLAERLGRSRRSPPGRS